MARLNTHASSSEAENDQESSSPHRTSRRVTSETSPSPSTSSSLDEEGESRLASPSRTARKRKADYVAPGTRSSRSPSAASTKRRKLDRIRQRPSRRQSSHDEQEERGDKQFYDPDQDEEERRANRKSMRDLAKELNDSRGEYLQANSKGLVTTIRKADRYFKNVKQTSDATIDSRLLVTAADLSYKKTNELALGDSSTGIDVDEFVSKCISFMRRRTQPERHQEQGSAGSSGSQSQRRRGRADADMDEEEDADQYNWEHLGRHACFPFNARPCLSGFLLGPLSVQKRVRQQTQRRAREARANPANAVRPQELQEEDLEKQETANLTVICGEIRNLLGRVQKKGKQAVEAIVEDGDLEEEDLLDLMREHGISDNECVPLFDFCVNPKSFGQTVENLFYVSFLIKEGSVGLDFDGRGMPTLGLTRPKSVQERQGAPRNQAVFTLDFDMWREIVESHGITKSLIPHRIEEEYDDGTSDRWK